jgi:DNA-binding response OmpR family regulator
MGNIAERIDPGFAQDSSPKKILLVDDNLAGAQTMRLLLEMEGFEVVVAPTGEAAIKAYPELRPSIVLLDIGLPDIDGCEVARRLGEMTNGIKPRFVAVSGWADEMTRARAQECGIEHYLSKPLRFEDLEELIALESPQ